MQDPATMAIIIVLTLVNVPLYVFLGKLFFGHWQDFWDCVIFWFKPDLWSFVEGEWWEDMVAEFKLGLFFATCFALVAAEFLLLSPLIATLIH